MIIQQISVFVENRPGTLAEVLGVLKEHAINLRALSVADTADFGILRMIVNDPAKVERILICSGKIRWDLVQQREQMGLDEKVAILTLERLFPLADNQLATELARYPQVSDIRWVQDEPSNQGPWEFLQLNFVPAMSETLGREFTMRGFTRPAAAAASTGSSAVHKAEEKALLSAALGSA